MANPQRLSEPSWGDEMLPPPMWRPDDETMRRSNIHSVLQSKSLESYDELYRWSIQKPEDFWALVLDILQVRFARPPRCVLSIDKGAASPDWLPGARMNIAESCFQAHPDATALIEGRGADFTTTTYRELRCQAKLVAHGVKRLGITAGDAVALFMPMTARSVAIYLGLILGGNVVVSIADSFSSEQMQLRLKIGGAKAVFTAAAVQRADKRIPLYSRVRDALNVPAILVDDELDETAALRPGDLVWSDFVADEIFDEVTYAEPTAAINVLFSSGTTNEPKAILWDHVTPIKAASDGHFHQDIHAGDVVAWPTNFGWMMGPWLTFATLINRGAIALFDGPPTDNMFGRFVQNARVNILGVVPSLVSKWRAAGCMEGHDWSSIRAFSSTGECSNPDDMRYLSQLAGGKPVIEYCGGTELGGGYLASSVVQPNVPSAFSTPTLGSSFVVLDEAGQPANKGEAFLVAPLMGMSSALLNGDHQAIYYDDAPNGPNGETLRRHGDFIQALPGGYFRALGRADDTMNVGGIKVGDAEIERVLHEVDGIADVAVIAAPASDGGPSRLVACVGCERCPQWTKDELCSLLQSQISTRLNPLFKLDDVYLLDRLPRTATNKIMRRELRTMYEAEHRSVGP